MPTLLPPNATPLERHLEQAMAFFEEGRELVLDTLWDPRRCPAPLLPWLAWALGVHTWDPEWSEAVQREVIAGAIPLHRIEGTPGALRTWLDAIGAVYDLEERPNDVPLTARLTVYNSAALGADTVAQFQERLLGVTRLSVELTVQAVAQGADVDVALAAAAEAVTIADFSLEVDAP